jgi:hypothetical protein
MPEVGKKFSDLTKIEAFEVSKSYVYLMREAKTETGYEDVIILGSKFVDSLALPEGDMLKSVYDSNDDGKVDAAQSADFATLAGSVDWTTITSVPADFPPSAHTHGASDVTDFAEAVAALLVAGDNITIDVEGGEITINSTAEGGGGGTVTSVKFGTASSALAWSGTNPITSSGTINIGLASGSDLQQLEALSSYGFAYRSSEGWLVEDKISWSALTDVPDFADVATSGKYSDLSGTPSLATVATSGRYEDLSGIPWLATVATTGAYSDLTGTPSLAPVATSGDYNDLENLPSLATVATSGAYSDLTGTPSLATVATSGKYEDLSGTPTLGTAAAADTGDFDAAGAASSAQSYAVQRGNHTGTQSADTISDFAAAVYTATAAILQQGSNITLTPDSKAETITIAASGGGGGGSGTKTLFDVISWVHGTPPSSNFATLGTFEYVSGVIQGVHQFSDAVAQSVHLLAHIRQGADLSNGADIRLLNSCHATSGDYVFDVKLARVNPNGAASSWTSDETVVVTAQDTNTKTTLSTVSFAEEDLPDGLTGGDWVWISVTRDTADGDDDAEGIARLIAVDGEEGSA